MNKAHRHKWIAAGIGISSSLLFLVGCAGGTASFTAPTAQVDFASHRPLSASNAWANIYVADYGNSTVSVYDHKNYNLTRTISQGVDQPDALAVDGSGNLYVSNYGSNSVSVYALGASQPSTTITDGVSLPLTIALDPSGKLYVGNYGTNTVTVYAAGTGALLRTISSGIALARGLAFDAAGNLYASNYNNFTISVYRPGTTKPKRTISQGINGPLALAFDGSGNLYVANFLGGSVTIYAPGSDTPFRTLSQGLTGPDTLTFTPSGDLYVANCSVRAYVGCWKSPSPQFDVAVYDSSSDAPKLQISNGVASPDAVLIEPSGKAIVADNGGKHSSFTVYVADGNTLLKTVTDGVHHPVAAVLGP
jgi:DNA-binding beta-propeller fold protein YncE